MYSFIHSNIVKEEYKTWSIYLVMYIYIHVVFDFQCKMGRNGHIKNKYHILEKW